MHLKYFKKFFGILFYYFNKIIRSFIYRHFDSLLLEKIHEKLKKEDNLKTIKYPMEIVKDGLYRDIIT